MSTTVDLGKITASVDVGTTTTGAAGTNASVTNVGTTQDAVLNFTIPRGAQGVQGPQGSTGPQGPAGPTGPQGPMGDVAVITPEQQAAFTMYSTTGQNTDGPMTQKAVTDNLVAGSISYDNSLNWYTEDNIQRVIDELREDDYNILDALGMSHLVSPALTISATKNTTVTSAYNIRKGDRFRVKTSLGSGVSYVNVSTRSNGVLCERILQSTTTNQDVIYEALEDADEFSAYSNGGVTTITIDAINKEITPYLRQVTNCLKRTVYGSELPQESITLSFVQGGIDSYGQPNTVSRRIRTGFIKINGKFEISVSTLKYHIYYYTKPDYNSYEGRESASWMHGSFSGFYVGYILIAEAYDNDGSIAPSSGNGTLLTQPLDGGLDIIGTQFFGIKEEQKELPVTFTLGVWNSYSGIWGSSTTRMSSPKIKVDGSTMRFIMNTGYKYSMLLFDDNRNVVANITNSWKESDGQYHELKGLHGYITFNVARTDDATITTIPDFGFELISIGDHTSVGRMTDFVNNYNGADFFYTGAPISLQRRNYWMRLHNGYPTINSFTQQGMAVYGDVAILGSSSQQGTSVKAEAFKISDNTKLKSMFLPRGGYSDIHSNVLCFSNIMGSGNLPYLYVSQWNEQKGCFVYDIASDYTATLQQVILPTNVSASLIGGGNIDWIVDTDNNRLISIGYIDTVSTLTPANGMQVCIFELPALTESVVNLTDADVLDSFHIDEFYVRQDCCYNNGNIYMMCGASNTLDYTKIAVINLAGRNVASVIDLKWLPQEPEGIDVYGNSLFIRVANNKQMYRLYFD